MSLNVMIGNDVADVQKITVAIDKLQESVKNDNDPLTEDVVNWLKDILNILTNKDFGQEMYDPSELLGEINC